MYRFLIAAAVLFAFALPLSAQSTDHWTGFYIGGNAAASSDKADAEAVLQINQVTNLFVSTRGIVVVPSTAREFAASRRKTNWSGGGQIGYQWQVGGFVIGPEADFNPFQRTVSLSQSEQLPPTVLTPNTSYEARRDVRISREFSIRARAGAAFGKNLVYGTFGYSRARVRVTSIDTFINPGGQTAPCTPLSSCSQFNLPGSGPVVTTAREEQSMDGWTGGFGFARKLGKRVSVGFEYRRTDYRSKTFALDDQATVNTGPEPVGTNGVAGLSGGVVTDPTRVSLKNDYFGVRVNFHF